jgi:hypothetical protein
MGAQNPRESSVFPHIFGAHIISVLQGLNVVQFVSREGAKGDKIIRG